MPGRWRGEQGEHGRRPRRHSHEESREHRFWHLWARLAVRGFLRRGAPGGRDLQGRGCRALAREPCAPRVRGLLGDPELRGPREPRCPSLCRAVRCVPLRAGVSRLRGHRSGCGALGGRVPPLCRALGRGGAVGRGHRGQHLVPQPCARRPPAWGHARGCGRGRLCRESAHEKAPPREACAGSCGRGCPRLRDLWRGCALAGQHRERHVH